MNDALCDYSYRSISPTTIPSYLVASPVLRSEFSVHEGLDFLAELSCHLDHKPPVSEALERAFSTYWHHLPPRWFKNGILLSSSRFPPNREMLKGMKLTSEEATQYFTLPSGSVGDDNDQEGYAYVCTSPTKTNGFIKRSSRNPTQKITPLLKRPRKSSISIRNLTIMFFETLIYPNDLGERGNKNEERLPFLQQDFWVQPGSIKPQEVVCRGCSAVLHLDARTTSAGSGRKAKYYYSPWIKHRNKCKSIHRDWLMKYGYDPEIKLSDDVLENCRNARTRK